MIPENLNEETDGGLPAVTCCASSGPYTMLAISGCAILTSLAEMASDEPSMSMMCFGMLAQAVGNTWLFVQQRRVLRPPHQRPASGKDVPGG